MRSILLDVQVQIAARRRSLRRGGEGRAAELFGDPGDGRRRCGPAVAAHDAGRPPASRARRSSSFACPCTYDFEVTATKYFQALGDGEVPLEFLFSGTAFYAAGDGRSGGADRLGQGSGVPAAGVASGAGRWTTTSPAAPGCASSGTLRAALRVPGAEHAPGWEQIVDSLLRREGEPSVDAVSDRRRRALRGLRAVALPAVGGQEPAALDLRRRLPAPRSAAHPDDRGRCRRSASSRARAAPRACPFASCTCRAGSACREDGGRAGRRADGRRRASHRLGGGDGAGVCARACARGARSRRHGRDRVPAGTSEEELRDRPASGQERWCEAGARWRGGRGRGDAAREACTA